MPDRIPVPVLDRVKKVVEGYQTQKIAAEAIGIPYATLQRILANKAPLTFERAEKIAHAADKPVEFILYDDVDDVGDNLGSSHGMAFVPLHDVLVSAGHGVNAVEAGQSAESLGFPADWLRQRFGDARRLRVVHVKGDSMAPTLHDGDMVMIDIDRRDPVDGIFVLRLEDQLMVKRVHFPSARRVLVTSDNRDYDRWDRMIDLESDASRELFQLIGRVVWVGKSL